MTDPTSSQSATAEPEVTAPVNPEAEGSVDAATAQPQAEEAASSPYARHYALPMTPEASPDGGWLAYLMEEADGSVSLWLSPVDGGDPQRVELPFEPVVERDPDSGRLIRGPQWSPDGSTIALTGMVEGEDRTAIWLVPSPVASAAEPVLVAATDVPEDGEAAATDEGAEETPDSESTPVAVADPVEADAPAEGGDEPVAAEPDQDEAVALEVQPEDEIPAQTRIVRMLTWGPGSERSPRWTPDGNLIAFVSTRDRHDVIALATTAGDEATIAELLTWGGGDDREPVWSRDGKFLAFTRQRPEGLEHADICVYRPETGELTNLTEAKASAVRHSLDWVAGRNLVAYVTRENDWLSISVINADNKAGWAVTRESGDKTEPRFHPTEARLVYIRTEGFSTVCCERGLHASGAVALDPGEGVVFTPRWLKDKRVAYGFSAPMKPFGFLVQENLANAERTGVPVANELVTEGMSLRHPVPFEFAIGDDEQFSGMLYRPADAGEPAPAIVYLADGPLRTRRGEFQAEEQALTSHGAAVLSPVIHGATGFGVAVEDDLADFAHTELEVSDIAEAGYALGEDSAIDPARLAVVGTGFGGTLALLTAGARPGVYSAVVAVDPITDWAIELAEATPAWRNWVNRQYGMPLSSTDIFALRSPATFAAVIDVPLMLVGTSAAPVHRQAQLELFEAYLDATGVAYEHIDATEDTLAGVLASISARLSETAPDEAVGGSPAANDDAAPMMGEIPADELG